MVGFKEIEPNLLIADEFIAQKVEEIARVVGDNRAITALSGGVDSSVVTVLGHKALGTRLIACFIDNGLMRRGEPQKVVSIFKNLNIPVKLINAQEEFFQALAGIIDPEAKREAISQTFYKEVFGKLVKESGARYLLQGTILTDIEETVAGIKRQHNVFEQLGIDPQEAFGYQIIEPLIQLRKDGVRQIGKALGLPESTYKRMPFPGPALAARVIGEASRERIVLVRKTTAILEEELSNTEAFQYMAILHQDEVTGIREGKRAFGKQIEIRCWDSLDARVATVTNLPFEILKRLSQRITTEIPEVVSVTYNITDKPPSTMEAV